MTALSTYVRTLPLVVPICAQVEPDEGRRHTRYWVTPTLSVEAPHVSAILPGWGVAVRFDGADGDVVSAADAIEGAAMRSINAIRNAATHEAGSSSLEVLSKAGVMSTVGFGSRGTRSDPAADQAIAGPGEEVGRGTTPLGKDGVVSWPRSYTAFPQTRADESPRGAVSCPTCTIAYAGPMRQMDAPSLVLRALRLAASADSIPALSHLYQETLGLPAVPTPDGLKLTAGRSEVEFSVAASGARPFYHYALLVPGDRFAAAARWLIARGVTLLPVPGTTDTTFDFDLWHAQACYFEDPAGNIVELIAHRGQEENGTTGPFSPTELAGVSEIGLVVDDLAETAAALDAGLGLRVWDGSTSGRLAFVGRQAHTLILVPRGWGWLPTGRPAEVHPLEVTLGDTAPGELTIARLPYRVVGR
ncbi:MAG: Glyoxalase/bleomycin resistance protein/dioxygenase [Solirubrobacterales bacterium]|nr:Glyoxalase/bleomycin resistance protein/dioxygenase [Solirubrobacterales bacterium]